MFLAYTTFNVRLLHHFYFDCCTAVLQLQLSYSTSTSSFVTTATPPMVDCCILLFDISVCSFDTSTQSPTQRPPLSIHLPLFLQPPVSAVMRNDDSVSC